MKIILVEVEQIFLLNEIIFGGGWTNLIFLLNENNFVEVEQVLLLNKIIFG